MPRIRSLKPEYKTHRKVAALSDRDFRLWVALLSEADDEGRFICDERQLRNLIWAYHPRVSVGRVADSLVRLAATGLIRRYEVDGVRYGDFPSWHDHQHINRRTPSKLPKYKDSLTTHGELTESSVSPHVALTRDRKGSEGIGEDRKGGDRGGKPEPVAHATNANDPSADPPKPQSEYERNVAYLRKYGIQLPERMPDRPPA
jgi:hypothetical protein